MKFLLNLIMLPWKRYQEKKAFNKRIEELRKRDPFIYK
jgi:hypothetical protein